MFCKIFCWKLNILGLLLKESEIDFPFYFTSGSLSAGASPLHSPGNTPTASPGSKRKDRPGSHPPPLDIPGAGQFKPMVQENIGGTTYFYTEDQHGQPGPHGPGGFDPPQSQAGTGMVSNMCALSSKKANFRNKILRGKKPVSHTMWSKREKNLWEKII